jgi:hypothetical protein
MVSRGYMLDKPSRPSPFVRYLHWKTVPAVINGLGAVEALLERLSVSVRRSPARPLAAALVVGVVVAASTRRKHKA